MFWTFVDRSRLDGKRVLIDGPAGHHLARVLRVRPGEHGVVVSDGQELEVVVSGVRPGEVAAEVQGSRPIQGEPPVDVSLLLALLPNPDFDSAIEGGTAVGISRFVAVEAERSVSRTRGERLARWRSIARSAAEQSHRGRIPSVDGPMPLARAIADEVADRRLLALDPRASTALRQAQDESSRYALAIGPEGGWTDDELAMMRAAGGIAVSLGPRILRARLAPVVAAAILVQQS